MFKKKFQIVYVSTLQEDRSMPSRFNLGFLSTFIPNGTVHEMWKEYLPISIETSDHAQL